MKNRSKLSILKTVVIAQFLLLSVATPLFAITDVFPDPVVDPYNAGGSVPDMSDAMAVVARSGGSWALEARVASFKVYSTSNLDINITFDDICNALEWGDSRARLEVYRMNPNESTVIADDYLAGQPSQYWSYDTDSCGGSTRDVVAQDMAVSPYGRSAETGHEAYYVWLVKVTHIGGASGINGFRIRTSRGLITFRDLTPAEAAAVWSSETDGPYQPFAMLDQVFDGDSRGQDSFEFRFSPNCTWTDGATAWLKWFDADYGLPATNELNGISFTLWEENPATGITQAILTRSNGELGSQGEFREASFQAYVDRKYRWVWEDVDNVNGIQFWAPFSEINYNLPCNNRDWEYDIDRSTNITNQDSNNNYIVDNGSSFTISSKVSNLASSDTAGQPYYQAIRPLGDRAGDTDYRPRASSNLTQTNAYWEPGDGNDGLPVGGDRTRTTTYTVNDDAADGTRICFYARVNPSRGEGSTITREALDSGNICFITHDPRTYWEYEPETPTISPSSDYRPKPEETITVSSLVRNILDGTGKNYTHTIKITEGLDQLVKTDGSAAVDTVTYTNQGALTADDGAVGGTDERTKSPQWVIKKEADNDARICFEASVYPWKGQSTPTPITTDTDADEASEAVTSAEGCVTVYNERFGMEIAVTKTTPGGFGNYGDTLEFSVIIQNSGDYKTRGTVADYYPGAAHSNASGIDCNFILSGTGGANLRDGSGGSPTCFGSPGNGDFAYNESVYIDITGDVGDQVCLKVEGDPLNGFSDGVGGLEDFESGTECITIAAQPFVELEAGDAWAGANFDDSGQYPIPSDRPCKSAPDNNRKIAGVSASPAGWLGSFVRYAAYALGVVENFSSDGEGGNTTLTFENEDTLGNYTETPLCIPDYYGILTNAEGNTTLGSTSFGLGSLVARSQNVATSDVKLSASTNLGDSVTLVVDGNVTILGNIETDINFGSASNLNIPVVVIVANGNIYIDQAVTQVDAFLVAHGDVWTCSREDAGVTRPWNSDLSDSICTEPLEVNGAIIADRVNFMRTHGDTGDVHRAGSLPAEIVRFLPELYLAEPVLRSNEISSEALHIRLMNDLPPVF